tara:strand:+ start:618 stop:959 length:342 start_codon:yes stop_codon:yes gene_type:complete
MYPSSLWYDPCPIDHNPKIDKDGLEVDWEYYYRRSGYIGAFVNPPYSNPLPWVKKAIAASKKMPVVMLLKHDSSTEWFRLLHEAGARFLMINKRLKHRTGKGAAFPSVLAVLT